jgi:hypothetical protein
MAQQNVFPGRAPIVQGTVDAAFQQINANFIKSETLKSIVAASTDFEDFQIRIAAL